jgi:mRNA interferase HigB
LHSWFVEVVKATWRTPQDIEDQYASASICGNNRVVFNVGGNKYRLVVEIQYQAGIVWVKFVGTHAQYDRIDVETVNEHQADPHRRRPAAHLQAAGKDLSGRGGHSSGG